MKRLYIIRLLLFVLMLFSMTGFSYEKTKGKRKSVKSYGATGKKRGTYYKKSRARRIVQSPSRDTSFRNVITSMPFFTDPVFDINETDIYTEDPDYDATGLTDSVNVNPYKIELSSIPDTVVIRMQDEHLCDYHHPFPGEKTSGFGPRWHRYHCGVDIDLETGDSVKCAFEGTVRIARRSPTFGYVVMIRHKNGLETIYAHLSRLEVYAGQHVEAGTLIGLGGNTGHSLGSHLHFEVRFKGYPIDPEKLISFEDHCLVSNELVITKSFFDYWGKGRKDRSTAAGGIKYYKVRKGDTLASVARKLGTSARVLQRLNGMGKNTRIRAGKVLKYA
ncbi:MAG: peptidoglycan DD-metalloendopeptidase family protein [Bacteroidota bacterium]|jgi:murein DD-endopeptidase MepM/ murein hydrolase activator NlpD